MKYLKLALVVISVTLIASCSKYYSNDVNGTTWTVDVTWDSGSSGSSDITFNSDGTTSWGGTWTQDGTLVNWSFDMDDGNGNTITVNYEGVVALLAMTGTCDNSSGDYGTFTASKQ